MFDPGSDPQPVDTEETRSGLPAFGQLSPEGHVTGHNNSLWERPRLRRCYHSQQQQAGISLPQDRYSMWEDSQLETCNMSDYTYNTIQYKAPSGITCLPHHEPTVAHKQYCWQTVPAHDHSSSMSVLLWALQGLQCIKTVLLNTVFRGTLPLRHIDETRFSVTVSTS